MRTLIVEDSGYMADALARLLALLPALSVIGQAGSRAEALRLAVERQPDLVLSTCASGVNPASRPARSMGSRHCVHYAAWHLRRQSWCCRRCRSSPGSE